MGRAPCCDKSAVKKGPWSPEEDAVLKSHIEQHGTGGNWIALPHKIGLRRCGKSCRLRWLNYLRPNIKHGGFTEEEDSLICSLYMSIGSRWSIIASHLSGRTDNDIKNYWNTKLKKKLRDKLQTTESKRSFGLKQQTNVFDTSYGNNNSVIPDQFYGTTFFHDESNMDAKNVLAAASSSSSQNYDAELMIPGIESFAVDLIMEEMVYGTEMMKNVMGSNSVGYPYSNGIFYDGIEGISEDWSYTGVNLGDIGQ